MSFTTVKTDTNTRFNEVQILLTSIIRLESASSTGTSMPTTPLDIKIIKGLFYVHLYSVMEKSVNDVVQKTLLLIGNQNVKNRHFTLAFNTISMMNKIKSIKDSSYKKIIPKNVDLFKEIGSTNVISINETAFAILLQNVWVKTINEVRSAFGIAPMNLTVTESATIDEVVDNRNAIAHGRKSPSVIGSSQNSAALNIKLQLIQTCTLNLIDDFEVYYNNKKYLKPIARKYYT